MATSENSLLEPFVWGQGGRRKTPSQIEKDERLALLLAKQGTDSSPVQHWTQGGARVMSALAGVMREKRAENAVNANANHSNLVLQSLINQQPEGPSVIPAPQAQQPQPPQTPFAPPPQQAASPFAAPPDLSNAPDVPQMTEAPQGVQPSMTVSPDAPPPAVNTAPPQAPAAQNGAQLNLDPQSVNRIKKTLLTEVVAGLPEGAYNPQAAGIVDTIMNRVVSGQWGGDVKSVVNAPYQFSDINGPPARSKGRNNVDQITDAWLASPAGKRASQFVDAYLAKRSGNAQEVPFQQNTEGGQHFGQLVGGHLNYANPHYSDASNLSWINKLEGPVLGAGTAIHRHGTAGNNKPVDPTYRVNLTQPPQQAQQAPLFLGDSHAAALAQFGQGKSLGVNGANIAQSVAQLQNAPQGSTVFMSAGTNDAVGQFNPEAIRQQVARAAEIAKAKGINLTWTGPTGPRSEAMDKLLAEATAANGIQYRSTRGMNVAMQPDGVHAAINPQGYGAMWNAINQQPQQAVQPFKPFNTASIDPNSIEMISNMPADQRLRSQQAAEQGIERAPRPITPEMQRVMDQIGDSPQQRPAWAPPVAPPSPDQLQAAFNKMNTQQPQRPPIDLNTITWGSSHIDPEVRRRSQDLAARGITPPPRELSPEQQRNMNDIVMQQPQQLAQAGGFDINNMNFRAPSFAQQQAPQAAPQQQAPVAPQPQSPQRPPINPAILRAMTDPTVSPQVKAVAGAMLQRELTANQPKYETKVLPNGDIAHVDERGGTVRIIHSAPKTNFGVIGKDEFGRDKYGFINPQQQSVNPYNAPQQQPQGPSTIPPVPAGVDPKVWLEKHSQRATADALGPTDENVTKLRGEIRDLPSYKNMAVVIPKYNAMVKSAANDNRASDLSLVYSFMKLLDPGSVVRESEISMAQQVPTLPQQYQNQIKSFLTGQGRLPPEVRQQLMGEANIAVQEYRNAWDNDLKLYRGIIDRRKMSADDVYQDFEPIQKFSPQTTTTAPTINDIEAEIKRRGLK